MECDLNKREISAKSSLISRPYGEWKTYFGESLLLQVSDNRLTDQITRSNNVQHFIVILPDQSELESVLGRIDWDSFGFRVSSQDVY